MTHLLLLVTLSRILGAVAKSLGYLEIIGEIIAGLMLGPAIFNIVHTSEELSGIVELGVFLLIFSAGLEMELHEIINALKKNSLLVAASGFLIPLVAGVGIGTAFSLGFMQSVCIGLCMAITALPVVIRFLGSAGILDTEVGHNIIGAAIIIDVAALLVLGIVFDTSQIKGFFDLVTTVGNTGLKMAIFFALILIVNKLLRSEIGAVQRTERAFQKLIERVGEEAIFGLGVFFVMVFATISESLGFHFIIGAFFGGLLLNKDIIGEDYFKVMSHNLESISNGFLTPVFFAYIGLRFSTEAFSDIWLAMSILVGGYLFKVVGAYAGAQLANFNPENRLKIGIMLNSRGVLDLVVADLAFEKGYINSTVFSILVVLGISTVIVNPIMYKRLISSKLTDNEDLAQESMAK
ncbi:MAG: cation:proton antiporter [Bdellovibrionales bacterium]|nr:cation:proton antiporter [Bdellovibrionales bacterium]